MFVKFWHLSVVFIAVNIPAIAIEWQDDEASFAWWLDFNRPAIKAYSWCVSNLIAKLLQYSAVPYGFLVVKNDHFLSRLLKNQCAIMVKFSWHKNDCNADLWKFLRRVILTVGQHRSFVGVSRLFPDRKTSMLFLGFIRVQTTGFGGRFQSLATILKTMRF